MANFELDFEKCKEKYPNLSIVGISEENYIVQGEITVFVEKTAHKSFEIKFKVNKEAYPFTFPTMYEIVGVIPKNMDYHINPGDSNSCCVAPRPEMRMEAKKGISFMKYLDDFAYKFLASTCYRFSEGYYPHGEYSHGEQGNLEYLLENLGAKDFTECVQIARAYQKLPNPSRTSFCPCGKKKVKWRKCHKQKWTPAWEFIHAIGEKELIKNLNQIKKTLNI